MRMKLKWLYFFLNLCKISFPCCLVTPAQSNAPQYFIFVCELLWLFSRFCFSQVFFNELRFLGDFEIFLNYLSVLILGILVYTIINFLSFRDLLHRFGFAKTARRDFYECGFKPQKQQPTKMPIQFMLICVFFLLYDIELIFIFPYISGIFIAGGLDSLLLIFFFALFFMSLAIDYERHALYWQY